VRWSGNAEKEEGCPPGIQSTGGKDRARTEVINWKGGVLTSPLPNYKNRKTKRGGKKKPLRRYQRKRVNRPGQQRGLIPGASVVKSSGEGMVKKSLPNYASDIRRATTEGDEKVKTSGSASMGGGGKGAKSERNKNQVGGA